MRLLYLIGLFAIAGCGSSTGFVCYPVEGQVLMAGKPLAEAMVVFHRRASDLPQAPRPIAYTDAAGRFKLTTLAQHDGAPAGDYAITVELRAARLVGEELIRDGANMLPPRYANPQSSPLTCEVVAEHNRLAPLNIETR